MHRRAYADDPDLCDRVFELLASWLPVLPGMRQRAGRFGDWRWEDVSTPFVHERDGRVVSHVGVLELDLVCHGEVRRVGGIHAVCTHPSSRRQGLYRSLMEEVLAYCDERYATLELTTLHPEYYLPFGFRHVPEQRFVARTDAPGGGAGFRPLDLARPQDRQILDDGLARRAPVSRSLGVLGDRAVFRFNLAGGLDVQYCEALDALAVWTRDAGGRLELLDLSAPELPPWRVLAAQLPEPVREVRFHFHPGALEVDAEPEPVTDDWLMVRGEFPYGDVPRDGGGALPRGMLSPLARH